MTIALIIYCIIGCFVALFTNVVYYKDENRKSGIETLMKFSLIVLWLPAAIFLLFFVKSV